MKKRIDEMFFIPLSKRPEEDFDEYSFDPSSRSEKVWYVVVWALAIGFILLFALGFIPRT